MLLPQVSSTAPASRLHRPFLVVPSSSSRQPPLESLLKQHFGIDHFRGFQREAIEALLDGEGQVLLVAPTGGGKSLCYQFPAVALDGTALVLSPLISLMEDQVRALESRGIPATFIASTLPREELVRRMAGLRRGAYKIVYAAPERLAFDGFMDALGSATLSLVAIDEAHCIVQWGHDFRPDYLRIGEALERLRPPRVIACTATATEDARTDIMRRLGWSEGDARVILRGFARPNLHLSVQEVDGPRSAFMEVERSLLTALGGPRPESGAAIVYAATRRGTETLARRLYDRGFTAAAYHAGLEADLRARISAGFADRGIPVVVATNAFGMGIDRPDVRVVVHAQPPSSIEAYYQEVGRAGRDGAPATGLLLFSGIDIALRRRMATHGEGGLPADPKTAARNWGLFRELLHYVDAATCRHDFILRYFGDEAESLGGCGHCDVCQHVETESSANPERLDRDRDVVRRALAGVARARGAAGMQAVAAMLVGESNARVVRAGFDRLSTFGVLAGRPIEEALGVLRVLLANGWIDLSANEFPVPMVTPVGWRVMKGEVPVQVRLPEARPKRRSGRREAAKEAKEAKEASREAKRREKAEQAQGEGGAVDEGLFEALRAHRAQLAKDKGVPAYVVAHDRTLRAMAERRPGTLEELEEVHGMGPAKMKAYGEGWLEVVRGFLGRSGEGA